MTETVALNYRESGSGRPLVLMHGMFGSLNNLSAIARLLAQHYRVIRVDARNHGDSPHHERMDYPAMGADVVRLLDDLEIMQADLIGHSMGGKVMMQTAIDHPDRVRNLVVMDIAPVAYPAAGHKEILDGLLELYNHPPATREEADQTLESFVHNPYLRSFLLTNLARTSDKALQLRLNVPAIYHNYQPQLTAAPSGPPFRGPTLFLRGSESPYIRKMNRPQIKQLFPAAQLQTVIGASHMLHTEKPEEVASRIRQFLDPEQA